MTAAIGKLKKFQSYSLVVAGIGTLACIGGGIYSPEQFFRSYLFGFLFWFSIAIGALGVLMIHRITSGAWGDIIRPLLEAASATLPWLAILFIPLCFGLHHLYTWADPAVVASDTRLMHKAPYLNAPFFWGRAAFYFLIWSYMAWRLVQWSGLQKTESDDRWGELARRRSAPWFVLYFLTLTFSSIDWMMSIEPHWYSTVYETIVITAQGMAAVAFVICVRRLLHPTPASPVEPPTKPFIDLGNILLTFVMFWAYVSFSQYIIVWSGNIPEEISWYLHRQQGGWFWVAMAVIFFQFFFPFFLLLGRRNKATIERLAGIAIISLVIWSVDLYWMIAPPYHPAAFSLHWLDFLAPMAVGGFWMTAFLTRLAASPRLSEILPEVAS